MSSGDGPPAVRRSAVFLGLLPPLNLGVDATSSPARIHLPLRESSLPAIVRAIEVDALGADPAHARGDRDVIAVGPCADLIQAMSIDPALVLWQAIVTSRRHKRTPGSTSPPPFSLPPFSLPPFSLPQLAADFWAIARSRFASMDALASPPASDPDWMTRQSRWRELDAYFQTLPIPRWTTEATLWLDPPSGSDSRRSREIIEISRQLAEIPWAVSSSGEAARMRSPSVNTPGGVHQTLATLARRRMQTNSLLHHMDQLTEQTKRGLAGRLAYGLSHEINNPLANISTRCQSLRRRLGTTDAVTAESLGQVIAQSRRAHAMIADLMFYARPPEPDRCSFDLSARIADVIRACGELADEADVDVRLFDHGSDEPDCFADASMIGDAVAAILVNAIEAISHGGQVLVEVRRTPPDWVVEIADSGPGLSAEACRHAFDPYHSGREAGRGLGLGLCRADRIARLHRGRVTLMPALAGCVARLQWPIATA